MGRLNLFFGWLTLLGVSLYCAYRTNELRDSGRQQVAVVTKVSGQVFQRPEVLSVFEIVLAEDLLFNGDFITTGAGASTEIELLSSKTLVIGENSLVQLSFNSEEEGSDIVTLLKGDVIARGSDKIGKRLTFTVGKHSIKNIEADSGVRIMKSVDDVEATIKVVSGRARLTGSGEVVREMKINQQVKVVAEASTPEPDTGVKSMSLAALSVPIIPSSIGAIMAKDEVDLPESAPAVKPVSVAPVKEVQPVVVPEPEEKPEPVVVKKNTAKKMQEKSKKMRKISAVAPNAPAIVKAEDPYKIVLFSVSPGAFSGSGLYVVKGHRLFAKVTGSPTPEHLLAIMKRFKGDLLFRGNAASLLGGIDAKVFGNRSTVFAVNKNGIQKIDAALVRSRPVVLELLKKGGYSIFTEQVNLMNVGH